MKKRLYYYAECSVDTKRFIKILNNEKIMSLMGRKSKISNYYDFNYGLDYIIVDDSFCLSFYLDLCQYIVDAHWMVRTMDFIPEMVESNMRDENHDFGKYNQYSNEIFHLMSELVYDKNYKFIFNWSRKLNNCSTNNEYYTEVK